MATLTDRIFSSWESWYPTAVAAAAGVGAYLYGPALFAEMKARGWADLKLYDAVFDIIVVTTPFLFTVYAFVITAERGFIARMKHSIYFAALLRYSIAAIWLGVALMVATVPLQIAQLRPSTDWETISFAIWAAVAAAAFAALFRATRLFIVFAVNDR